MTHDEMIAVIAAHRDGKQIEFRENASAKWLDVAAYPSWNFGSYDYRAKPEPRVLWAGYLANGILVAVDEDEESVREHAGFRNLTIKKFVEVEE